MLVVIWHANGATILVSECLRIPQDALWNPPAFKVKHAGVAYNSKPARPARLDPARRARLEKKYAPAGQSLVTHTASISGSAREAGDTTTESNPITDRCGSPRSRPAHR